MYFYLKPQNFPVICCAIIGNITKKRDHLLKRNYISVILGIYHKIILRIRNHLCSTETGQDNKVNPFAHKTEIEKLFPVAQTILQVSSFFSSVSYGLCSNCSTLWIISLMVEKLYKSQISQSHVTSLKRRVSLLVASTEHKKVFTPRSPNKPSLASFWL